MNAPASFSMRGMVKHYPGVTAVDGVDLECGAGEIHAIAGENGAGKSTLMRILYGMTRPDGGEMEVNGKSHAPAGPRDALTSGVGMVHQHFMLIPPFTVLENAILGEEPRRGGVRIDRERARAELLATAEAYGMDLDPDAPVEDLSVGERQRLEIIKVLMRGARVLILDEPTAVLVPSEVRALMETLRSLAADGASIVFITHRLREVLELADRVTVMRAGRVVGVRDAASSSERDLAKLMVGREPAPPDGTPRQAPGEPVLTLRSVGEKGGRAAGRLRDVSFDVRAGEILGIAGVEGNGQRELTEILGGLRPFAGEVHLGGESIAGVSPGVIRRMGLAHVPEDRVLGGLVGPMTVGENLILGREAQGRFRSGLSLHPGRIKEYAESRIRTFDIRPADPGVKAESLSGGNQQKVVFAREAEGEPRILVAAHPTRGVDVGAMEAIHREILALRDAGVGILLVSADLSEVLMLSDRIVVLYTGLIAKEFRRGEADEESLGVVMTGGTLDDQVA